MVGRASGPAFDLGSQGRPPYLWISRGGLAAINLIQKMGRGRGWMCYTSTKILHFEVGNLKALLALEDGLVLRGRSFTGEGESAGEVVFNTAMTGYQ